MNAIYEYTYSKDELKFSKKKKKSTSWNIPLSEKSSTRRISSKNFDGVLFITLCTVLINTDQPSLWNTIMTLVLGKSVG